MALTIKFKPTARIHINTTRKATGQPDSAINKQLVNRDMESYQQATRKLPSTAGIIANG